MYELRIERGVKKDLQKLPQHVVTHVLKRFDSLSEDPFPAGFVKLQGTVQSYRVRVGDYRILYEVDREANLITVFYVRHRKDVYRKV